jgi:hypothetical protein
LHDLKAIQNGQIPWPRTETGMAAWTRQVAYAILIDVFANKLRARHLAGDFGRLIENPIYEPHWLLTETDIQSGIFEVERTNDLR